VCITTNQAHTKSNPNPNANANPATKRYAVLIIHMSYMYPEKFIR